MSQIIKKVKLECPDCKKTKNVDVLIDEEFCDYCNKNLVKLE